MGFEPSRLAVARKKRGLTQKDLAHALGLSPRHLNSYEAGTHVPPEPMIKLIAEKLGFPIHFFMKTEVESIPTEFVSFRAMSKMTSKMRDQALASASIGMMVADWLEEKFNLPQSSIPDLRGMHPELAAESLRREWALGDKPIKNIIHLLESKGARVYSLASDGAEEIDAFCFWRQSVPYIFLNISKSSERVRHDVAHELGHLVLHRHGQPNGRSVEHEADSFASAFLMPRSSILANSSGLPSIPALIQKKKIWNVSLASLVHRLRTAGILTEWHYKQLFIEISQRGFRKSEPESSPHESSLILKKVIELLKSENKNLSDLSKDLDVSASDINSLFFGFILTALSGSSESSGLLRKPDLRLVE